MTRTKYLAVLVLSPVLFAQTQAGESLEQAAARLKASPASWPVSGFIDPADQSPAVIERRMLMTRLISQMESDYLAIPDGRMNPHQEGYYADLGSLLFERGGYSNWHLAQVLDFRAGYSIAERVYRTGVVTPGDRRLIAAISARILPVKMLSELAIQEGNSTAAFPQNTDPADALSRTMGMISTPDSDFPPSITLKLLGTKSAVGLLWRRLVQQGFFLMNVLPLMDTVEKNSDWTTLSDDARVRRILTTVEPAKYHMIGREMLLAQDFDFLRTMMSDKDGGIRAYMGRE